MGKRAAQGKRGRESYEAGKNRNKQVRFLAGRTGTVKILIGFLNLRVTDSSTDGDRPTYRLTLTLAHAVHAVHGTDCGWHHDLDFLRPTICS